MAEDKGTQRAWLLWGVHFLVFLAFIGVRSMENGPFDGEIFKLVLMVWLGLLCLHAIIVSMGNGKRKRQDALEEAQQSGARLLLTDDGEVEIVGETESTHDVSAGSR